MRLSLSQIICTSEQACVSVYLSVPARGWTEGTGAVRYWQVSAVCLVELKVGDLVVMIRRL